MFGEIRFPYLVTLKHHVEDCGPAGVDFTNICLRAKDEKFFMANGVGRTAHKFGEFHTNFSFVFPGGNGW